MIEPRLFALTDLILSACGRFGLPSPRAVRLLSKRESAAEEAYGLCLTSGRGGHEIGLTPAWEDAMPLLTLAHELAHLRRGRHDRRHAALTCEILHHWQRNEGDAVRIALEHL